jgi:hypothetical protein
MGLERKDAVSGYMMPKSGTPKMTMPNPKTMKKFMKTEKKKKKGK